MEMLYKHHNNNTDDLRLPLRTATQVVHYKAINAWNIDKTVLADRHHLFSQKNLRQIYLTVR